MLSSHYHVGFTRIYKLPGIMGFARVMPGDTFEVSIRHGNQKWKSKGYVSKDNEQKWDQDKRSLNVQICSTLTVKVRRTLSLIL